MIKKIMAELKLLDDQGRDWYGWATNQLSHAFLGVAVAVHFPQGGIEVALIIALLKECSDLMRDFSRCTLFDSAQDVLFWALGACLITLNDKISVSVLILFALICGIVPRIRRMAKNG